MAFGPKAGLAVVEPLVNEPSLESYPHLYGVLGDILDKLDRHDEAREAFEKAAELTKNERERHVLLGRAAASAEKRKATLH
jgi:predicted RNA polymerase sigma factor